MKIFYFIGFFLISLNYVHTLPYPVPLNDSPVIIVETTKQKVEPETAAPPTKPNVEQLSPPNIIAISEGPPKPELELPKRHQITYDQRQDGEHNYHAEIKNILVFIQPQKTSNNPSLSLIDLLSERRNNKYQTKQNAGGNNKNLIKDEQNDRDHDQGDELLNERRIDYQQPQQQQQQPQFNSPQFDEFVEGRTPYKVDISSTVETGRNSDGVGVYLDTVQQPQIIGRSPSQTTLVQLIKPVPLEIIEQPSSRSNKGNQNQNYLCPVVKVIEIDQQPTTINKRQLKSLNDYYINNRQNNNNDDNTVTIKLNDDGVGATNYDDTFTADDDNNDDDDDVLLNNNNHSFDSLNIGNLDALGVDPQFPDGWELKLIGAHEQCGPDRRRDSYGVCQFVN